MGLGSEDVVMWTGGVDAIGVWDVVEILDHDGCVWICIVGFRCHLNENA